MIETMTPDQIAQMMNQNVLAQPTTITTTTYMPVSTATAVPHPYTGGIAGPGRLVNPHLAQSAAQPLSATPMVNNEPVMMQTVSPKPASSSIASFAAQRLRPMMVKLVNTPNKV